ncbi:hypothetical protein WI23_07520 [Burkholderia oklahomensis C6786]|nr:hypothetical protein WI23_07520 [Burkholderia oklahomensis C6786]KUY64833.1 hypothetical protein WI23_06050 [Burkholderia oklahomensis C6786]
MRQQPQSLPFFGQIGRFCIAVDAAQRLYRSRVLQQLFVSRLVLVVVSNARTLFARNLEFMVNAHAQTVVAVAFTLQSLKALIGCGLALLCCGDALRYVRQSADALRMAGFVFVLERANC